MQKSVGCAGQENVCESSEKKSSRVLTGGIDFKRCKRCKLPDSGYQERQTGGLR